MADPTPPLQRRLVACTVALFTLLALTALLYFARHTLDGWATPLGLIAPLDLLAVALAMAVGGYVAQRGFRGWAVALVVMIGLASAIAAYGFAPPTQVGAGRWLVRNTGLQMVLSAAVAWFAAQAGERFAARRTARGRADASS